MKLYRISPKAEADPIGVKGAERAERHANAVHMLASAVRETLSRNDVDCLRVARVNLLPLVAPGERSSSELIILSNELVRLHQVYEIVSLNLNRRLYCKLRDASCRFVDFTHDYDVMICLRHSDQVYLGDGSKCEVEEVSALLTETDAYDL